MTGTGSIEAINEQLLRAIGVGIALIDRQSLAILFRNSGIEQWVGSTEPATLSELFPVLDRSAMEAALAATGRYAVELRLKLKRRQLVVAVSITDAAVVGQNLLVLEGQNITRIHELESMIDSYAKIVEKNTREIKREKERVERLLLNIMPKSVFEELKTFGVSTPQRYDSASILMLDFVGFTEMTVVRDPTQLVGELNDIFTSFDRIAERFGCERIKTIGDAYMAVAGLPDPTPDHALNIARMALMLVRYLERRNQGSPHQWRCRIGIGCGPVVGSIVGIQKYVYDIFGPGVNLASRMEAVSGPMQITVPSAMVLELREEFVLESRGEKEIKGFGTVGLFTLVRESRAPIEAIW